MDCKTSYRLRKLKNHFSTTALTASTALFLSTTALSQAASDEGFGYGVALDVATEDNVYLQDANETSSTVSNLSAIAEYNLENPSNIIHFAASGKIGNYSVDSDDNYIDIGISGDILTYTSKKTTLFGSVNYTLGHDRRGEGRMDTITVPTEPDKYTQSEVTGGFGYGADQTGSPRAEFEIGYTGKEYDNNRTTTYLSDLETTKGKATLFYKIQPSTTLLLEATQTAFDYNYAALDSTQTRLMAGVTWEITGQTSGSIKAGSSSKDFDEATIATGNTTSWELAATWSPRSYTNFTLSSSRDFDESKGTGDYSEATGTSLNWNYGWNSYLTSNLSLTTAEFDYVNNIRADTLTSTVLNVNYKLVENINIGIGYSTSSRNSNVAGQDYTNNRISAQIALKL